jgi:DNA-binding MarR family transcriptional regulator
MQGIGATDRRDVDELVTCLEELVASLRLLPTTPTFSLNAAAVLRTCVADGPTRVSELADRLGVSQPAATQTVDRLSADGLVVRTADPTDRRAVLVSATGTGRRHYAARHASRVAAIGGALDDLAAAQRRQLLTAVPALQQLTAHLTP